MYILLQINSKWIYLIIYIELRIRMCFLLTNIDKKTLSQKFNFSIIDCNLKNSEKINY